MFQCRAETRDKNQFHLQSVRLSSIQNGVCDSSVRIFNKLPPYLVQLRENTTAFNNTKKFLVKNAFYSTNEYMSGDYYEEEFKFLRKERS